MLLAADLLPYESAQNFVSGLVGLVPTHGQAIAGVLLLAHIVVYVWQTLVIKDLSLRAMKNRHGFYARLNRTGGLEIEISMTIPMGPSRNGKAMGAGKPARRKRKDTKHRAKTELRESTNSAAGVAGVESSIPVR